jgi:hypothetical protein
VRHGFDINWIGHDGDVVAGHAESADQIIRHAFRSGDDQVGGGVSRARRLVEDGPPPAATPGIVAVFEKRRHRRLLIEDHSRADCGGANGGQH